MDEFSEEFPRIFLQMTTREEMVNHILNPYADIEYHQTVTNLRTKLSQIFDGEETDLRSKDNLERIREYKGRFVDKIRDVLDKELFSTRWWIDLLRKNEAVADLLRKKGNEYFRKSNYSMALKAYTLAGMYALKDSKGLALSYSNRSACFAETKSWYKCLEDIKNFERIWKKIEGDSTPTGNKVAKRKEMCLKEIGDKKEDISLEKKFGNIIFKLKNPRADLPSLEDCLGVKTDPKKGRGIYNISDKAIEPGTVVILDYPYSHVYNDSFDFQTDHCSACRRILKGYGIPCEGCVFNLYCSEACATSEHHVMHAKYECKLAPYLFEVIPRPIVGNRIHLALSILLKLGPEALLEHFRQISGRRADDKDGSSFASYLPIYNSIYHDHLVSERKLLWYTKNAIILTEILDSCTDYFTCLNLDVSEGMLLKEEFAKRLLLHQICNQVNANTLGYSRLPSQRPATPEELLREKMSDGRGIYPVVSLINHSCSPNAAWCSLPGGVMAVMALEYIVPGQEVLATYRSLYFGMVREERRENLKNSFGFKCDCTACSNNWPLMEDLKSSGNELEFICPNCKKMFEPFHKTELEGFGSAAELVCSRKCGWRIRENVMKNKYISFGGLYLDAINLVRENKILKGFMDVKKCVQYFDAHCSKPNMDVIESSTTMANMMHLLARRMFE